DGLSFEHSDADSLLANQTTVFAIPTLSVDAYDAKTGQLKWSTPLGQGHVTIISQLDGSVVRVYYGDTIYELDSETGNLLATMPKRNIVWVSGNIVLKTVVPDQYQLSAYDRQTGALLWNQGPLFFVDEPYTPQVLSKDILIVAEGQSWSGLGGICAMNLQTGKYNWCRPEDFFSMMAINDQSQLGYGMRNDLVLLTVDLQTGNIVGETSFLSSKPFDKQVGSISSVTVSDGVVVVSFHDSFQTFGLEFLP
ncbi:MAG: PQQ-binding-like beta-propeller repeat protein, partial [Anaerolineales bacterium]